MKGVIGLVKLILHFFSSFFDFEKINSGYVHYLDYIEFRDLVHYHVIKLIILLVLLMIFAALLIRSTRKSQLKDDNS